MRSGAGLARRRKWARAWYARNYKGQDGKALYEALKWRGQQRMAELLATGNVIRTGMTIGGSAAAI
jgi:hypothetical protein